MILCRWTQFAGLNDKQYYFHDGTVSLPFGHFLLNKTWTSHQHSGKNVWIFRHESRTVHLCERLRVLRSIYAQPPQLYLLNSLQIRSLKSARKLIINGSLK